MFSHYLGKLLISSHKLSPTCHTAKRRKKLVVPAFMFCFLLLFSHKEHKEHIGFVDPCVALRIGKRDGNAGKCNRHCDLAGLRESNAVGECDAKERDCGKPA